eukprot:gnl/MRDRNA2_/MRDRNA2_247993_c0_seq1.p1 gnl/MRDRNA2_/MRDRNA2_247993_c0~~gnl/MRDRNA2_/MRDRNA2_247993_c0_seq1.p1  ORF type:complete len:167 (+),score=21.36 gnl/MRDRNA2_/MRDRNA2_247993_c0_seq1:28-501(+)
MVVIMVKAALIVNEHLASRLCGVVVAGGFRVIGCAVLLAAGVHFDPFFDSPKPRPWHPNSIATGLDTGVTFMMAVSCLAICMGPQVIKEPWYPVMLACCLPVTLSGCLLRWLKTIKSMKKMEFQEDPGSQNAANVPLIVDVQEDVPLLNSSPRLSSL